MDVRPRVLLAGAVAAGVAFWIAGGLPFAEGVDPYPARMALAVTVMTAFAWLGRAMPLAPASLLPLALMPLLGVQKPAHVAPAYSAPILWLFFGGFILALAIEKCGLHRRLALRVIAFFGLRPRRLVLGFMCAGAVLSMWISNTATSLMLLPIGWAMVDRVREEGVLSDQNTKRLGIAVMLGIAYGCSVGGIATPIGTPPNLVFFGYYDDFVAAGAPAVSFIAWMAAFLPLAVLLVVMIWLFLAFFLHALPRGDARAGAQVAEEIRGMGPMTSAQRRVLWLFGAAIVLWVTRGNASGGVPGWEQLLPYPEGHGLHDSIVAVGVAIAAFLIPAGGGDRSRLMDWGTARRMPFEILFMFGGGLAIAGAFKATGLSQALGDQVGPQLGSMAPFLAVGATALFLTFLTEVTSNLAITQIMVPVLGSAAISAGLDPRLFVLPASIAASCAFMFPIATPPNAVVFSSGKVTMQQMARTGLWLNLASVLVLTVVFWLWVLPWLGVSPTERPEWLR